MNSIVFYSLVIVVSMVVGVMLEKSVLTFVKDIVIPLLV